MKPELSVPKSTRMVRRRTFLATALAMALAVASSGTPVTVNAQPPAPNQPLASISPIVLAQIEALHREKESRTPIQRKISSRLLHAYKIARGDAFASGVPALRMNLPRTDDDRVILDVRAVVNDSLLERLRGLGPRSSIRVRRTKTFGCR